MEGMTMNKSQATILRDRVGALAHGLCKSSLDFAHALYLIKHAHVRVGKQETPIVVAWGFDNFETYVERELGYHYGTANSYVRVHQVFNITCKGAWNPEDMPKSITKLRALSKVVRPDTCTWWFREAQKMSCCEVEAAVERELTGGGRKVAWRTLHMPIKSAGLKAVNDAIAALREGDLSVKRGNALAQICEQWLEIQRRTTRLRKVG